MGILQVLRERVLKVQDFGNFEFSPMINYRVLAVLSAIELRQGRQILKVELSSLNEFLNCWLLFLLVGAV